MEPERRRDPWVIGGLALLGALSLGGLLLYRSAPQSVAEVRSGTWVAARPNAHGAQLGRARERLAAAEREAASGNDSLALALDSAAAEHAWRARELAEAEDQRAEATGLWAEALLRRAELLRRAGTGKGLRRDDNQLLRHALALTERVLTVATAAPQRQRATTLRDALTRELRTGPMEWLPIRR